MTERPQWVDVGAARVWLLNDGQIPATGPGEAGSPTLIEVNAFLVHSQGRLILVDSGFGDKWLDEEPDLSRPSGSVIEALRRAGFGPDDVDVVVNTHLHVDHAGGDTARDASGALVASFADAEYVVQNAEWAFAGAPPSRWSHLFRPDDFRPLASLGRLRLVEGVHDLTAEVRCMPAPGHTPGHQVVLVESHGSAALLAGDALRSDSALTRLDESSDVDVDQAVAARTRQLLTGWVTTRRAWVGFAHVGTSLRRLGSAFPHGDPTGLPA